MGQLLDGVKIFDIPKNVDERGFFSEIYRSDWKDLLHGDTIVQTNMSVSYPGMIRAWHRHGKGQVDYFLVPQGAIKLGVYDDNKGEINEIINSEEKLKIVRVPGQYWHGFKAIGDKRSIVVYFVNRLYDYNNPDEERRAWNDPTIIDKKTGIPFDWNRLPFK